MREPPRMEVLTSGKSADDGGADPKAGASKGLDP